jgi:hypothetical protein
VSLCRKLCVRSVECFDFGERLFHATTWVSKNTSVESCRVRKPGGVAVREVDVLPPRFEVPPEEVRIDRSTLEDPQCDDSRRHRRRWRRWQWRRWWRWRPRSGVHPAARVRIRRRRQRPHTVMSTVASVSPVHRGRVVPDVLCAVGLQGAAVLAGLLRGHRAEIGNC